MNMLGDILYATGLIITLIGHLAFLVAGFRKNFWWGISMLFIPIVPILIFMILEFRKSLIPFSIIAIGIIMSSIGYVIG